MLFIVYKICYVLYFIVFNLHIVKLFLDKWKYCITTVNLLKNLPVVHKKQCNEFNKPELLKDSYLKKLERLSRQSFFMQSTKCLHYNDKVQKCYMSILKKRGFDNTKKYTQNLVGIELSKRFDS